MKYPFLVPHPARLSGCVEALERLEESGRFSNFGPINTDFESAAIAELFGGSGSCTTVCNATLGLMLALRCVAEPRRASWAAGEPAYALMPSFTFAGAVQAAVWAGLTPLFCDVEPDTWLLAPNAIRRCIERLGERIAVIYPYATFGNNLDVAWYNALRRDTGIPVVVDAAASLGSETVPGRHFGRDAEFPVVFSMHATKTFATGEAGLVYSEDAAVVQQIRAMSNFGFDDQRASVMPGLNAKLPEIGALLCREKLREFPGIVARRQALIASYKAVLADVAWQRIVGCPPPHQFMAVLLPEGSTKSSRDRFVAQLEGAGVQARTYFSPHAHEHPYFRRVSVADDLSVTQSIAARIVSLPLHDRLAERDIEDIGRIFAATREGTAPHAA